MAPVLSFIALAAILPLVCGHFTFVRIKKDGKWNEPLQYIRNKTSPYDELKYYQSNFLYRYYNWPTYYIDRPESVRCGRGNMDHANVTDILTVNAGETIGIAYQRWEPYEWTDDMFYGCPDDRGTCHPKGYRQEVNHPGPLLVHLSKVPDGQEIQSYDGSGEWVKIHSLGLHDVVSKDKPLNWILYNQNPAVLPFKIPTQTPAGHYLMRMDILWPGMVNEYTKLGENLAQMYPSCAHLNIVSDSKTAFPQGVKIPEIFAPEAPGMSTSWEMQNGMQLDDNFTYPGGPLWDGEKLIVDEPVILS